MTKVSPLREGCIDIPEPRGLKWPYGDVTDLSNLVSNDPETRLYVCLDFKHAIHGGSVFRRAPSGVVHVSVLDLGKPHHSSRDDVEDVQHEPINSRSSTTPFVEQQFNVRPQLWVATAHVPPDAVAGFLNRAIPKNRTFILVGHFYDGVEKALKALNFDSTRLDYVLDTFVIAKQMKLGKQTLHSLLRRLGYPYDRSYCASDVAESTMRVLALLAVMYSEKILRNHGVLLGERKLARMATRRAHYFVWRGNRQPCNEDSGDMQVVAHVGQETPRRHKKMQHRAAIQAADVQRTSTEGRSAAPGFQNDVQEGRTSSTPFYALGMNVDFNDNVEYYDENIDGQETVIQVDKSNFAVLKDAMPRNHSKRQHVLSDSTTRIPYASSVTSTQNDSDNHESLASPLKSNSEPSQSDSYRPLDVSTPPQHWKLSRRPMSSQVLELKMLGGDFDDPVLASPEWKKMFHGPVQADVPIWAPADLDLDWMAVSEGSAKCTRRTKLASNVHNDQNKGETDRSNDDDSKDASGILTSESSFAGFAESSDSEPSHVSRFSIP